MSYIVENVDYDKTKAIDKSWTVFETENYTKACEAFEKEKIKQQGRPVGKFGSGILLSKCGRTMDLIEEFTRGL
jgi:hypothetical protein